MKIKSIIVDDEKHGRENVTIITRSNREAVQLNQFVRRQINGAEEELDVGDLLMIVRKIS